MAGMMKYFPVSLDIKGCPCVVVGGGRIAERKIVKLLSYGGHVRVVSPTISPGLRARFDQGKIEWRARSYQVEDLGEARLVVAATSDRAVNQRVAQDAQTMRVFVNVVDSEPDSSFIFPALLEEAGVVVAVSSHGKSPGLSKRVRDRLNGRIGREFIGEKP
jgi:siroheme synthase-like protein